MPFLNLMGSNKSFQKFQRATKGDETSKQWKWCCTNALNITTERAWVAMPREDYQKLRKALEGINPEAVPDLLVALRPLAQTKLRDETAATLEAHIIECTGDGPWASWVVRMLTEGADIARAAITKAETK